MNATQMLDALEAALADAAEKRLRKRDGCLDLVGVPNGELFGQKGKRIGIEEDSRRMIYQFTVAQVQDMSDYLRNAIREDAGLPPLDRRRR